MTSLRKKYLTSPEQVRFDAGRHSSFYTSPIEGMKAQISLSIGSESTVQQVRDYLALRRLGEDDSRMLSPEEANKLYPAPAPYREPVKESIAKYNAEVAKRSETEKRILQDINQQSMGSTFLPFAGALAGGFLDPVNLAMGAGVSLGMRGIGYGLLRLGAGRYTNGLGRLLSGGNLVGGKFVEGSLSSRVSAEVLDQTIGNIGIEGFLGSIQQGLQQGFSEDEYKTNVLMGTLIGSTVGLGLPMAFKKFNDWRAKGIKTTEIEIQTGTAQAEAGLRPNVEPILIAHKEGLSSGIKNRRLLDIEVKASNKIIYLPFVDLDNVDPKQAYISPKLIGYDTIQYTTNPQVAMNAARHPLLLNQKNTVKALTMPNLKPMNIDRPMNVIPDIETLVQDVFGKKKSKLFFEEELTLKDLLEEAQYISASKLEQLQEGLLNLEDANAFSFIEKTDDGREYDVIEMSRNKESGTYEMIPNEEAETFVNSQVEGEEVSDAHILKAQKELINYAQDPKNLLTYDPTREVYNEITTEPVVSKPREVMLKLDEEVIEIDEQRKTIKEIEDEIDPEAIPEVKPAEANVKNLYENKQAEADAWIAENGHLLDDLIEDEVDEFGEYEDYGTESFYEDNDIYGFADIEGKQVDDIADAVDPKESEKLRKAIKEMDFCNKRKR